MKNVHDTKMYSLGHAGSVMESTALIDIPGVFMTQDGEKGLQEVLKDCSFSGGHQPLKYVNTTAQARLKHHSR